MDGERRLFTWSPFAEFPVSPRDLFCQRISVYLSGASSVNAVFGAYITPHIKSNLLGFLCGLLFVVGIAVILYEIHLRIPVLKFLFSGKPAVRQDKNKAVAG